MALNDDKERLFNYICDIEEHALPSAQTTQTKLEVQNWLKTQAERRVVLFKDQDGKTTGGLIDLRRKLCSQYLDTGSCRPTGEYCALWHVCKRFIEGKCKGECGRSHSFRDKSNRKNTTEAGLENFPDQLIRNIVAYSLPQVCLLYSNPANQCEINACPYLHICPSVVTKTACECSLSHNLLDRHNKKILERYNLSDSHLWFESEKLIAFVLCNILHPFQQKVCKKGKKQKYILRSNLTSPGSKTTSELVTSRKGEVSSIPPDSGSLDLQGNNSTSHASTSSLELLTSRASSVSPNPTSVTRKQTGLLQACPTEMMCSNRSGNALTSQDSRIISELHTLKPDSRNCSELEQRSTRTRHNMRNPEGQVPSTRLSSNEIINPELSNQTNVLSASNLTSQDSRIVPDFHTSKDDALFRPEQEKRENMQQKMALGRHFHSMRLSYTSTTRRKQLPVQYRSLRGVSTIRKHPGVPCISEDDRIPHHWSSEASDTNYARVKVESDSSEFKEVETLFRKTMKEDNIIDSFERVENLFLWETYCRKKDRMVALAMQKNPQRMASDFPCEKRLFHGTSPDAVDAICKQNFDWRVCGKSGTKYGEGSYFATNASYSHSYAKSGSDGFRFTFLARVLVGSFIKGKREYRKPPKKDPSNPSSDLYDSCVDNERNPEIFVIFDGDQFYPEYVIKYFTLDQDRILLTSITAPRSSQCLTAKPKSPSTSLSANRAMPHSASNLQQPIASPRGFQDLKANTKSSITTLSTNRSLLHSASNLQQPVKASTSSQGGAANLAGSSDSFTASDSNAQSRKKQRNDSKSRKCSIL